MQIRRFGRETEHQANDQTAAQSGGYLRAGVDRHESLSVTQCRGLAVGILCPAG